jgi:hypothetical protein
MNRNFIYPLVVVSLLVSLGFISNAAGQSNRSAPGSEATPTPKKPDKQSINLSDREIFIRCKPGAVPSESCSDKTVINVAVRGLDERDGKENKIKYTVSGGRIIGQGGDVKWDLSDVSAGTYTITVDFLDNNDERQTKTETISVKNCKCRFVDACPRIEISTPKSSVKAGETVTFTVKQLKYLTSVTYNWTVSAGEIIEGQGTSVIKVKTTREMTGVNLTAAVEIDSEQVGSFCENSASETVLITK